MKTDGQISIHRPQHSYPRNKQQWGQYLSGLIDGDGYISREKDQPRIVICFHIKDISLAFKVKRFLGYGTVSPVKKKKAINYVLTSKLGLVRLCNVIDKLEINNKQLRLKALREKLGILEKQKIVSCNFLHSYWLAGFIDSDGHLKIYIRYRVDRPNPLIQLTINIDQCLQNKCPLLLLKNKIGGTLYYNNKRGSISYSSSSLQNTIQLIKYLDYYQLCSNKYKEYVIWRRAFFVRNDVLKVNQYKNRLKSLRK